MEIFEKNLIDDYYPEDLENVCLYDFVKWYSYKHTDASSNRVYQNWNSLAFQIIVCTIPVKKMKEKSISIPYYYYLFPLEMKKN